MTAGQTDLTAVRMTGKNGLRTVLHEAVQGTHIGGVRHADTDARLVPLIEGAGSESGVLIVTQVRVIHTGELQAQTLEVQRVVAVNQARPAARLKGVVHPLNGQGYTRAFLNHLRGARLPQVTRRVLEHWREIAIRAGHKHAGEVHERVERLQQWAHTVHVGEVITRVHHQIRLQGSQRVHEVNLLLLARNHVHIRNMQNPKVGAPGGQHRQGLGAELKIIQLNKVPIRRRGGPQGCSGGYRPRYLLQERGGAACAGDRHGDAGVDSVFTHYQSPFRLQLVSCDSSCTTESYRWGW